MLLKLDGMTKDTETENPAAVRRKRASNSKSRGGCLACRIRHVKCDETKPSCNRCIKSGMECDWKRPIVKSTPVTGRGRVLLPKAQSSQKLVHAPSRRLFKGEQEHRYFRVFCDKISYELSGLFDSALWNRAVLQACESEPGIRHVVIALGALGHTSQIMASRLPMLSSTPDQALRLCNKEAKIHYRFALSQYGTAIRLLRKYASKPKSNVRTLLLGSILTTCFETFHGDHQSAIAQIQSGLSLVEDWHISNTKTKSTDDLLGTTSPSPYTIEDDLMQALGRLDVQAMSFIDPRHKETHNRMRHYGQASINAMPTRFQSVKEARVYLELVMRRFMHFMAMISSVEGVDGCLRHTTGVIVQPNDGQMSAVKHLEELKRWHRSFLPLLEYARRPEGRRDFLAATALEAHYLPGVFVLDLVSSNPPKSVDSYHPIFREVVSLCKSIIQDPDVRKANSNYSFDLHVLCPLYITGLRCRHSGIRREAVALLLSAPRREGVWDGMMVGKIVQWVVDIEEEEGLDEDSMPIGSKVSDLNIDFNLQARTVNVRCLQLKTGVENPVERDILITW